MAAKFVDQLKTPLDDLKSRKPFFAAALATGLVFSLVLCLVKITLIADDFNYLARLYSPEGLNLDALRDFIARVPLAVVLTKAYFYLPGAEQMTVPAVLTYLIYVFSTARIFSYFVSQVRPDLSSQTAFWALMVFLLYPTHYEILYWLTAMPYIVGLALWALSLGTPIAVQVLVLAATFLNSEMYVLPAFVLPQFILFARNEFSLRRGLKPVGIWAAAIAVWFLVRKVIEIKMGLAPFHYVVGFGPAFLIGRLNDTFYQVYSLHFFKVLWANTAIYWIALITLLAVVFKRRLLTPRKFVELFAVTFSCTAIYWVFDRNAPRALFGAQIVICLFVFYVTTLLDFKTAKKFLWVFALVFTVATGKILYTKSQNSLVLAKMESEWSKKLMACQDPCEFDVIKLDDGIRGDWVMTYNSWPDFIRFIQNKYQIKKTLKPKFIEPTDK